MDYRIQSFIQLMKKKEKTYSVLYFSSYVVIFVLFLKQLFLHSLKNKGKFHYVYPIPMFSEPFYSFKIIKVFICFRLLHSIGFLFATK